MNGLPVAAANYGAAMLRAVADLLVPPRCGGCNRTCAAALCPDCLRGAELLALARRPQPLGSDVAAVAAYTYSGVIRTAILAMKVDGRHALAVGLGALLRERLALPCAPVTWVPSTRRRVRERGAELTRLLAGPEAVQLLRKTVERPDQTALDAEERRSSPAGAFVATARVPPSVVLVDDVLTTGATALAAVAALRVNGAQRVLVATLAQSATKAGYDSSS